MGFDEFFTNGDKPYAENLNDSLLLLDAFNVTVPVSLPDMFSSGEFSSTLNGSRKAGISIVTLKSVDSGVTIGSDEISGTGDVVFRVYPNFNSFYKWQSILLENSGTVSISFRKTDGTLINASVNNTGVISENTALKVLQEIDVVLSLSDATVSNILINFVNNQSNRTRTGALLEASQLVNVDGEVESSDTRAVSGDTVQNALNKFKNELFDMVYPVGSIYITDMDEGPSSIFGRGEWVRIEDRFLLGSGTFSNGVTGGSKDAIIVKHNHTQNSHNHTQNSHNHGTGDSTYNKFMLTDVNIVINGVNRTLPSTGSDNHILYTTDDGGVIVESTTTGGKVATNQSTTATNKETGVDGTDKNMPPYYVVGIWTRIG